jgi:ubiquinone/menaquinone biosynthesis C-methylase UbiE
MENRASAFDFQAEVGMTKHPGGMQTTRELAELCHMGEGHSVLDVGCGVGVTPCYLAKTYRCKVVGIDLRPRMIDRCHERARKLRVEEMTAFRVADAQDLPFDDDLFDAVITESVAAMVDDKAQLVRELMRVAKPGGYLGLNESTWLKTPPPAEIAAWVSQDLSDSATLLPAEGWTVLLADAGVEDIASSARPIDLRSELSNTLKRQGLWEMLRVWSRALVMYARNPESREMAKQGRSMPEGLLEYFGYGLYVGRKPGG